MISLFSAAILIAAPLQHNTIQNDAFKEYVICDFGAGTIESDGRSYEYLFTPGGVALVYWSVEGRYLKLSFTATYDMNRSALVQEGYVSAEATPEWLGRPRDNLHSIFLTVGEVFDRRDNATPGLPVEPLYVGWSSSTDEPGFNLVGRGYFRDGQTIRGVLTNIEAERMESYSVAAPSGDMKRELVRRCQAVAEL